MLGQRYQKKVRRFLLIMAFLLIGIIFFNNNGIAFDKESYRDKKREEFEGYLSFESKITKQKQLAKEPFKFNFRKIPFGKSESEVLRLVEKAKVSEDKGVRVYFTRDYSAMKIYFSEGIYSFGSFQREPSFLSAVVKKYTVVYDGWKKLGGINLYFVKNFDSHENYTLFLVTKTFKDSRDYYKNVFTGLKNSIKRVLGVPTTSHETKYATGQMRYENTILRALFGYWEAKNSKVFLLVHTTFYTTSSEIIYLSTSGWEKYKKACEKYEQKKKKKAVEESTIDDF